MIRGTRQAGKAGEQSFVCTSHKWDYIRLHVREVYKRSVSKEKNMATANEARAALESQIQSHRSKDLDGFAEYLSPEHTEFDATGTLLVDTADQGGLDALKDRVGAASDQGFKSEIRSLRHVKVQQYGETAVITAYLTGSFTHISGQVYNGPWRLTDVRVLQDGKWKSVHTHFSSLKSAG
jgi:hypothetical protein